MIWYVCFFWWWLLWGCELNLWYVGGSRWWLICCVPWSVLLLTSKMVGVEPTTPAPPQFSRRRRPVNSTFIRRKKVTKPSQKVVMSSKKSKNTFPSEAEAYLFEMGSVSMLDDDVRLCTFVNWGHFGQGGCLVGCCKIKVAPSHLWNSNQV